MRTYQSAPKLLAEIKELLVANKAEFGRSPLDGVIELLSKGRHYSWIGIYLALEPAGGQALSGAGGEAESERLARAETRTKILVSVKLARRELGMIAVESDREHGLGPADRVLLEGVATQLARFLSGPGKYLVRRAKQAAEIKTKSPQSATLDSSSPKVLKTAVAGKR